MTTEKPDHSPNIEPKRDEEVNVDLNERLTPQQAAAETGLHEETIRKAIREKRLGGSQDVEGGNIRYSTTRRDIEAWQHQRSGRIVAGYSKEAREELERLFGSLVKVMREDLEADHARLELDRQMIEEIRGLRTEMRERIKIDRELLALSKEKLGAQERTAEATEGIEEHKAEEVRPWYKRWFG